MVLFTIKGTDMNKNNSQKYTQISQPKLGQIVHVRGVLKLLGPADFITDPGFEKCPRFVG